MKFKDTIENLLAQKSKVKILRLLLKNKLEFTGREVARSIKMDHKTCHRSLKELFQQGVVLVNHTGGGALYKINKKNFLVKELLVCLFNKEDKLLNIMARSLIRKLKTPVVSAILFGSIVRGMERPTSDIDLLIVVSGLRKKREIIEALSRLEFDFICEYGNMLSPIIFSLDELRLRIMKKDRLISEILRKGNPIYGESIEEIIRHAAKKHPA